ncbi:unnamed protein product [Clonostachys rhizophaga]|uniref:Uncharacterized protein n=1 Tax=Clonostachys rhizophaga TaxID=160324 RepID=A0A9N9YLD0_9HYPO|nr:unnamed protein product [Clonostachys rhizophaga]
MINVTTSGIEHCVSRLNHESSGAIRKYEISIDDLTSPEPMTNSVCAEMDALRPRVACDGVRSQTWMFHPYSSVARITVTVTPTPMTFNLSLAVGQFGKQGKGSSNPARRTMTVLTYNLARTEMIPSGQNISCMMRSPGPCLSGF